MQKVTLSRFTVKKREREREREREQYGGKKEKPKEKLFKGEYKKTNR